MARPSAASDAAIRAQFYRDKRRSPRAQQIADDLEGRNNEVDTLALIRWNSGGDPALRQLGDAAAMVSPRGFKAAAVSPERKGAAANTVREALDVQPTKGLPASAAGMLDRSKDRLSASAEDFLTDADEYAGKPVTGKPEFGTSAGRREAQAEKDAEIALQQQGVSAEDYWERNKDSSRVARVTDGEGNVRVRGVNNLSKAYRDGQERSAVEAEAQAADRNTKVAAFRDAQRQDQDDALLAQLETKGSKDAPLKKDGTLDRDRASGMLAKATFEEWDMDKSLAEDEQREVRDQRAELSDLRKAARDHFGFRPRAGVPADEKSQDRIRELERNLSNSSRDRTFWRGQVEKRDAARRQRVEAEELETQSNELLTAVNQQIAKAISEKNYVLVQELMNKLAKEQAAASGEPNPS